MSFELRTERLVLREQSPADIDSIAAGLADFQVTRWLTAVPFPYTRRDAEEWVARLTPPAVERVNLSIVLPGVGFIGTVGIADELGYWLARAHWGHGYMTEAATTLVAWYFAESRAERLRSSAHAGNGASLGVQQKIGFVETGRGRRFVRSLGREVEHVETVLTHTAFVGALGRKP